MPEWITLDASSWVRCKNIWNWGRGQRILVFCTVAFCPSFG